MRLAVVGSREFPNEEQVREYVRSIAGLNRSGWRFAQASSTEDAPVLYDEVVVGTGDAKAGVDKWVTEEGDEQGVYVEVFVADWNNPEYKTRSGKSRAGVVRNGQVVDWADRVIIFWDGMSPGSKNVIEHCNHMMVDYEIKFSRRLPDDHPEDPATLSQTTSEPSEGETKLPAE